MHGQVVARHLGGSRLQQLVGRTSLKVRQLLPALNMCVTPVHLMILEMLQHVLPMNDWYAAFDALQLTTLVSHLPIVFVIIRHKNWIHNLLT
jgi:hypothetical protein